MSKYEPLWKYIKVNEKAEYKISYEEIKNILGFDIDYSFLTYKKLVLPHTVANKITGFLLFIAPFIIVILDNQFKLLSYVFKGNIPDFIDGALCGLGLLFEFIGFYNNNHEVTLKERWNYLGDKLSFMLYS